MGSTVLLLPNLLPHLLAITPLNRGVLPCARGSSPVVRGRDHRRRKRIWRRCDWIGGPGGGGAVRAGAGRAGRGTGGERGPIERCPVRPELCSPIWRGPPIWRACCGKSHFPETAIGDGRSPKS